MSYASEASHLDLHAVTQPDSPADSLGDLGIREFARHYGHSEAEVRRAMRQLAVSGSSPGRGRPTRLSPEEQGRILDYMEGPAESAPAPTSAVPGELPRQKLMPRELIQSERPVQNVPMQNVPMQNVPMQNVPMQNVPMQNVPVQNVPVQNVPIQDMSHWDEPREVFQAAPGGLDPNMAYADTAYPDGAYPERTYPDNSSSARNPSTSGYPSPGYPGPEYPNPEYPSPEYPSPGHPSNQGKLQISAGNHRTTVAPPPLPQTYDLAQFRSPEAIPAIADPGEVANQAMAAIDALVTGMEADIRQQRHLLQETQSAAQALRLKAKHLQDKKLEYMIQSTAIGQSQQRCTAEIQEALGEVHALGKSPRSGQEPPSP